MPLRRQPPSLRNASIENIAYHFEDFWCAGSPSDLEHSEQPGVFTPFQYLCDDMIQEIIDMLRSKDLLRPHHFQLLLHSNIRRLKLDLKSLQNDRNYIMKILGTRCQILTHLELNMLVEVRGVLLSTLLRNLPEIVSLKLNHIRPCANVIKAIYEHCPNLSELHLFNCVLEKRDLLYPCKYPQNPKLCSKVRKLIINGEHSVSLMIDNPYYMSKDTIVYLLKNHPSLQSLGTCNVVDHAFDQMYGDEFKSSKVVPSRWIHNLLDITIGRSEGRLHLCQADRLDLTLQCCPFLTKLTLYRLRDGQSLQNVAKLKHLKSLSVAMQVGPVVVDEFSTHMAPLLSKIGHHLTELKLSRFIEVSLVLIGKCCHNLESLEFRVVDLVSIEHPIGGDVLTWFSHLTKLTVDCIENPYMSFTTTEQLCLMLQNTSNLVHFKCQHVIEMTDKVISEANKKHGFRHLRTCWFDSCPISIESIWMLLCPDNPLETVTVLNCNITSQEITLIQQEAKLRQFNIDILNKSERSALWQ